MVTTIINVTNDNIIIIITDIIIIIIIIIIIVKAREPTRCRGPRGPLRPPGSIV